MVEFVPPKEFYAAIGEATSKWASVEHNLADLFSRLVICSITGKGAKLQNPDGYLITHMIFHSSSNLRARLNLLDQMIEHLVSDETLAKEWSAVKNKTTSLYGKRNLLAHGTMWGTAKDGALIIAYNFLEGRSDDSMGLEQVKQAAASFEALSDRVHKLAVGVNVFLARRGEGGA